MHRLAVRQHLELVEHVQVAVDLAAQHAIVKKVHVERDAPGDQVRGDSVLLLHQHMHHDGPVHAARGPEAVGAPRSSAMSQQG